MSVGPYAEKDTSFRGAFKKSDSSAVTDASRKSHPWPIYISQPTANHNAHYQQHSLGNLWIFPPGPIITVTPKRLTSVNFTSFYTLWPQKWIKYWSLHFNTGNLITMEFQLHFQLHTIALSTDSPNVTGQVAEVPCINTLRKTSSRSWTYCEYVNVESRAVSKILIILNNRLMFQITTLRTSEFCKQHSVKWCIGAMDYPEHKGSELFWNWGIHIQLCKESHLTRLRSSSLPL